MLLRRRRLSIRPRRCLGRSNLGLSCILVLQGHKVTVVILGRPRRLVEADRRHGAPVAARAEVRDVRLGRGKRLYLNSTATAESSLILSKTSKVTSTPLPLFDASLRARESGALILS